MARAEPGGAEEEAGGTYFLFPEAVVGPALSGLLEHQQQVKAPGSSPEPVPIAESS